MEVNYPMSTKINWPLAHDTWDNKERDAMHEVIASGRFTFGEKVKKFEDEFCEFFDMDVDEAKEAMRFIYDCTLA